MKLNELSPVEGSTQVGKRKGRGAGTGNGKTAAAAIRARRPVPAVESVPALKAARCLWCAVSRSAASTIFLQSP